MESSNSVHPRPTKLSSSISMFIEDSRITAVANADSHPRNPGCFYTISTYSHTPIVNNLEIKNCNDDQTTWTFSHSLGGSNPRISNANLFEGEFQQLPLPLSNITFGGSTNSISSSISASCSSGTTTSSGGHSGPSYHRQPPPPPSSLRSSSSRPREVVHRIIRESSLEDDEDLVDTFNFNPQSGESSVSSSRQGSVSVVRRHSSSVSQSSTTSLPTDFERRISISSESRPIPNSRYRTTTLNILPMTPQLNVKENLPTPTQRIRDNKTFTTVNLTLRSPSAGSENKCFSPAPSLQTSNTNFNSNNNSHASFSDGHALCACGSSIRVPPSFNSSGNMTYSTYSGSRDGFEAEVQIQIGPNGGTISASRRRRETVELQQMNADLISAQDERKDKLHATLIAEKVELEELQKDILNLRSKLNPLFNDLEKLKDENQRLRIECQLMTREVDLYDNGTVPLGETNLEFYRDIYSGQDINALFGSTQSRRRRQGVEPGGQYVSRKPPPPRPPPPNPKHLPSPPREEGPNSEWVCTMCTFLNHPDLVKCEQCDMQRVSSREQNIRISIRRHQQPPPHRKVIHSWVV